MGQSSKKVTNNKTKNKTPVKTELNPVEQLLKKHDIKLTSKPKDKTHISKRLEKSTEAIKRPKQENTQRKSKSFDIPKKTVENKKKPSKNKNNNTLLPDLPVETQIPPKEKFNPEIKIQDRHINIAKCIELSKINFPELQTFPKTYNDTFHNDMTIRTPAPEIQNYSVLYQKIREELKRNHLKTLNKINAADQQLRELKFRERRTDDLNINDFDKLSVKTDESREHRIVHDLPSYLRTPKVLRSILKRGVEMNYSKIKKLDEESSQQLTEAKGPADECLCSVLSTPDDPKRSLSGSIKRAFANFSPKGRKKVGSPGQSIEIPLDMAAGKGHHHNSKEVVKRNKSCRGKCGCESPPFVLKHSYANIRITTPDISSICPCPTDCLPDKEKYKNNLKVIVERMAVTDVESVDSEYSLLGKCTHGSIPEPEILKDDPREWSDCSEWSSGVEDNA